MVAFEKGKAYYATSTTGDRQMVVACTNNVGRSATFVRVGMICRAAVRDIEGRDTAIIKCDDGFDYFVSASVEVDVENASRVIDAMRD